ncbi:hypothetical protein GCM10009741_68320 [Kribbella lupini]|uniref:Uncharacterized protein n=1 Tax=Kribbella lupini TaxID=291602 RepID=A0ABN2C8F5_9ACTN
MARGHGEGPSKSSRRHGDPQQLAATDSPQRLNDHNDEITVPSNAQCDRNGENRYSLSLAIASASPLSVNPTAG